MSVDFEEMIRTSIICALGRNREIGYHNELLWKISDDLRRFKKLTIGHPIIIGRKTFESIGRVLPGRPHVIISRSLSFQHDNCYIVGSVEEALQKAREIELKNNGENGEIFIVGGGEIYKQTIMFADRLYLTLIDDARQADVFFPDYSDFKHIVSEESSEYKGVKYKFLVLER